MKCAAEVDSDMAWASRRSSENAATTNRSAGTVFGGGVRPLANC
jgi:hypothetical protein